MHHSQPRVALHSLGCKLNQAELQEYAITFEAQGCLVVGPRDAADVYVINTCTVTAEAERKARQWLRMVRRTHPGALLVACGCGVQRARAEFELLADMVLGNHEKANAASLVAERLTGGRGRETDVAAAARVGRTRSLVKVQEGCATPCTYCVVPRVRIGEQSVARETVLSTVRARIDAGYREIVLTGTRIGAYRDGTVDLAWLVTEVLAMPGLGRLRLSSLQPRELTDALLSLWQDRRLCRHFHLALQSGSATVLRRMRRAYDPAEYADALRRLRLAVPGVAITTDVIVGFPGESDDEFEQTVAFCRTAGFARIHVFPYSRRPGTPAAAMPDQLPGPLIRKRVAGMERVAQESRQTYASSWLGRRVQVLWEEELAPGCGVYAGTSDNYLSVLCRSETPLHNVMEEVALERMEGQRVWARR